MKGFFSKNSGQILDLNGRNKKRVNETKKFFLFVLPSKKN
jgi:hypothetical protein